MLIIAILPSAIFILKYYDVTLENKGIEGTIILCSYAPVLEF